MASPLSQFHYEAPLPARNCGKVVVIGASGHAKVVLDILRKQGAYEIIGLLDHLKPTGFECEGRTVLGHTADLYRLAQQHDGLSVLVAVGDNWTRGRIVQEIRAACPGMSFASAIHPSAQIADGVSVGCGSVVMPGAVLNAGSKVGEFCIVNTRASLDHDSILHDFASLGPAATTGGNVTLGAYSNLGMAATILQGLTVGEHAVVGAGSVVLHPVPERVVVYGTPARFIRARQPGDRYLGDAANVP